MADTKISALTEQVFVTADDLLVIVDDPGGSPATKRITASNLKAYVISGTASKTLISEASPTGTTTVTFSSIPSVYKNLVVEVYGRSTVNGTTESVSVLFNNDSTAGNYRNDYILEYTATLTRGAGDGGFIGNIAGNTAPANSCGFGEIFVPDYAESVFNKMAVSRFTCRVDTSAQHIQQIKGAVEWESNAAITRLDVVLGTGGVFLPGSKVRLYGTV